MGESIYNIFCLYIFDKDFGKMKEGVLFPQNERFCNKVL